MNVQVYIQSCENTRGVYLNLETGVVRGNFSVTLSCAKLIDWSLPNKKKNNAKNPAF